MSDFNSPIIGIDIKDFSQSEGAAEMTWMRNQLFTVVEAAADIVFQGKVGSKILFAPVLEGGDGFMAPINTTEFSAALSFMKEVGIQIAEANKKLKDPIKARAILHTGPYSLTSSSGARLSESHEKTAIGPGINMTARLLDCTPLREFLNLNLENQHYVFGVSGDFYSHIHQGIAHASERECFNRFVTKVKKDELVIHLYVPLNSGLDLPSNRENAKNDQPIPAGQETERISSPKSTQIPENETIENVADLSKVGFPDGQIQVWSSDIGSLNDLQKDAINNFGLLTKRNLVVSAPTASGKTMLGELAALKAIRNGERAIMLFPLKALVNDKHLDFSKKYSPFGVKTIRATGEMNDDLADFVKGDYGIILLTYEKFSSMLLSSPGILNGVGTIVVDEAQVIADKSRGSNLELVLTMLRVKQLEGVSVQLILLSAVIGSTNRFEEWLGAGFLKRDERLIPLDEGILRGDGSFRYLKGMVEKSQKPAESVIPSFIQPSHIKGSSQDYIIPLVKRLVSEGKQVIVFRPTRGEVQGCAAYLARELGLPPAQNALDELPENDPSQSTLLLQNHLSKGVAFHTAALDKEERLIVEKYFRQPDTKLRVVVATTTLAMGINMPASSVIIAGLMHPGNKPYSVAEYKNMVGRAGRPGYAEAGVDRGTSYLIAAGAYQEDDFWDNYVLKSPEDLNSNFLSDEIYALLLRTITAVTPGSDKGIDLDTIISFLNHSFGAFQKRTKEANWQLDRASVEAALRELVKNELVKDSSGHFLLTEIGRLAGESGIKVKSVLSIISALSSLDSSDVNGPTLIAITQLTDELENVAFPANRRSTDKEPNTWPYELQQQGVPELVLNHLKARSLSEQPPYLRSKKAISCLLWMSELPMAKIEENLIRFGGNRSGVSGSIRNVASRTYDILPIVIGIFDILKPDHDVKVHDLQVRLESGVSKHSVPMARLLGSFLSRGDYLKLHEEGLDTPESLYPIEDKKLLSLLENNEAKMREVKRRLKEYQEEDSSEKSGPEAPITPAYE